jgi:hypothetical protein
VNRIALSLLLALCASPGPQRPPILQASDWTLGGTRPAAYVLQADGRATDQNGATIS